jgi:hypothetical protein
MVTTEKKYAKALDRADALRQQAVKAEQRANKEMRKDRKSLAFQKARAKADMLHAQSEAERAKARYLAKVGIAQQRLSSKPTKRRG